MGQGRDRGAAGASIPPALARTVPITIDCAILVQTLAALVKRRRGEPAPVQWTSLVLFTTASVAANAFHAFISARESVAIPGAIVAGLAPVARLAATHTLADLIVEPVPDAEVVELAPTEVSRRRLECGEFRQKHNPSAGPRYSRRRGHPSPCDRARLSR